MYDVNHSAPSLWMNGNRDGKPALNIPSERVPCAPIYCSMHGAWSLDNVVSFTTWGVLNRMRFPSLYSFPQQSPNRELLHLQSIYGCNVIGEYSKTVEFIDGKTDHSSPKDLHHHVTCTHLTVLVYYVTTTHHCHFVATEFTQTKDTPLIWNLGKEGLQ